MEAYLGAKEFGAELTVEVIFVPDVNSVNVTAASLTMVHTDGTTIGPFAGTTFGTNSFRVKCTPPKGGNWRVQWSSTPPGAVTDDRVYIDA